jgi:hypothetical protein
MLAAAAGALVSVLCASASHGQAVVPDAARGPDEVHGAARRDVPTGVPAVAVSEFSATSTTTGTTSTAAGPSTSTTVETTGDAGAPRVRVETGAGTSGAAARPGRNLFTGFHVRRSEMADPQEGGTLSFSSGRDNEGARGRAGSRAGEGDWAGDVYVLFDPQERGWRFFDDEHIGTYAFFEAHVATLQNNAQDNVRAGAAVFWANDVASRGWRLGGQEITDLVTDFSLRYEGDRDGETTQLIADLAFTFNSPGLGIGNAVPDRDAPVHFNWRPVVGIEGGPQLSTRDNAPDIEAPELRLYAEGKVHIALDFIRDAIDLPGRPYVFFQDRIAFLPTAGGGFGRNLLSVGFEVPIVENVGFLFAYTYGWDAPQYDKVDTISGGLSVRF